MYMKKNAETLREFRSVLNRQKIDEDGLYRLISFWGLGDIDLDKEKELIEQKKSFLSKSQRESVLEFIKLREFIKEREKAEEEAKKKAEAEAVTIVEASQKPTEESVSE